MDDLPLPGGGLNAIPVNLVTGSYQGVQHVRSPLSPSGAVAGSDDGTGAAAIAGGGAAGSGEARDVPHADEHNGAPAGERGGGRARDAAVRWPKY